VADEPFEQAFLKGAVQGEEFLDERLDGGGDVVLGGRRR
jgi:hypothetical protein